MIEVWKDVKGYEGFYAVSNYGNFISKDRPIQWKNAPYIKKGIQLKPSPNNQGYLQLGLYRGKKKNTYKAHKLVAEHFLVKGDEHTEVNHIDGNKTNNRLDNLEWCTRKENMAHAFETGLNKHGQESHLSLLTEEEVKQILDLRIWGVSAFQISVMFNVHNNTIRRILKGTSWTRLTGVNGLLKPTKKRRLPQYEWRMIKDGQLM